MSNFDYAAELSIEREYVAFLYGELDAVRQQAVGRLSAELRDTAAASPEERWRREVAVGALRGQVSRYRAAENGLCFGRLDHGAATTYIGRIGLFDEAHDYEPYLLDWRAPAARPFYTATAARAEGVARRRHLRARGREIIGFHDDVLDLAAAGADTDAALLAALAAPRARTMRDIVATIQAEQDEIIRLPHAGIVVIEGGPGTGKTAVALHRVAYLLYSRREQLSRHGVLMIGPNPVFLDFIGAVLPSLGETDVVFATPGELMPGVRTALEDAPEVKRVKGSRAMVDVLTAAIADRQELPGDPIEVELSDVTIDIDAEVVRDARKAARASGLRHNDARRVFCSGLLDGLAERAVDKIGAGWLSARDTGIRAELAADARAELAEHGVVRAAMGRLWPPLTPQRLLADLFGSRARLAAVPLTDADRALLWRKGAAAWTISDAPLLDEAAELLGVVHTGARADDRRERIDYARGVLDILDTDDDPDVLRAVDVIDATGLAERHAERDHRTLAERAAADREWTYGHVVVDEAQELSEMDWRVIMRRCPGKSMTIVGDRAQRRSPAGARTWADVLDCYVPNRWAYRTLTINYRTPGEIMDLAARVLAEVDPAAMPPKSVRRTGIQPIAVHVAEALPVAVDELVRTATLATGSLAVIAPDDIELNPELTVLNPAAAKGLEFDVVILVEPQVILESPCGAADLYVALTRATQRLYLLHSEPLPTPLTEVRS
ncbi:ATP-binding domain-containing protein [Nocardia iowensis]|uniref:ATP-binding domain-containing protein n=1 Tax=Nocardia iowensis TaxID=204891 RepID=A0ABX8RGR5_NOCIO|nr:ATP-binding domain-containing protein [Nocardia iowensis]QXN88794.1 ATP-binding domain-containing protein [Nocardia iowensis]